MAKVYRKKEKKFLPVIIEIDNYVEAKEFASQLRRSMEYGGFNENPIRAIFVLLNKELNG